MCTLPSVTWLDDGVDHWVFYANGVVHRSWHVPGTRFLNVGFLGGV